ncbi:MAG: hypothetical protein IPP15_07170 [Saprospiraceae bacterium]|uniref:Uncharacterized protein n=1 Tax=Candidatus Opimibacter skivensis TaxID=2982028 RepID=A0A9D7XMF4_9BACT|nr:hypothetical protein [Candidatus Opimibacter skivensis]
MIKQLHGSVPPNITTSCEFADDDLDELGQATAIDQCTPASQIKLHTKTIT